MQNIFVSLYDYYTHVCHWLFSEIIFTVAGNNLEDCKKRGNWL